MIFYRHIIQELIIPFIYSFCTIMFLFFMQLAVKVLDKVLNKGIEPLIIIKIFLLNSAWMVVLAVPMSVLVATLIGFGKMSSNNEIMILKASGVNLFRVLIPVISSAGILTTSLVFFHNLVLPDANHKAASLMSDITRKKPAAVIKPGILIRDFQGYAMMVRDIDHSTGKMSGVKVFSSNGKQDNSITVAEYGYINVTPDEKYLKVKLYNGETHSLTSDKDSADYIVADFSAQSIFIENIDSRFKRTDRGYRGDREKSAQDLLRDVSEYRSEKEDAERKRDKKIEEITGFIDRLDSLCSVSGTRSAPEPDPSLYLLKNTKEEANTKEERLKQNLSFIRRIASIDPVAGTLSTSDPDSVKSMETLLSLLKNNKEKAKTRIAKLKHSIRNLNRTIKNNKKRIWKYMVEVHKKYSVSFACIIFVLIGAPLGMMVRQGSMGVGVSYSVFFFILFWSTLIGGEALSDNLIIHPAITMWSCNLILLAGGLYLCSKLIRERRIISFGPLFRWAASLKARLTPSNPEKAKPVKRISPIHGIFRRILSLLTGTLPAYFLKHFFKFFFMVMLSLCLISVVIDYISNMKNFDEGTTVEIIEYYAYFIIWMSTILLPICLLLAAMFTSGKLSENSELTAMKASGLNFYRLTLPLVFAGFVFTGVDFYINEKVFPVIVPRKQELYDKLRHGKKAIQRRKHEVKQQNDFYYLAEDSTIYHFGMLKAKENRIKDVSKFTFSDNSLTGYIHAGSGVYSPDSGWEIMNTVSRRIKDNRTITVDTLGRETSLLADESPEKMIAPRLDIKDMSYWQTKAAIEKYKSHGKETKQYLSELHFKIAFPFMNFIVIILGISITASSHQKRQGMAVLFGIGLGFVFIYWISSQILLSFGKSGALPPITAAWLPNIVFFIISILFFRRAHR